MRLVKCIRAPRMGARQWAGNLRIDHEAPPGRLGDGSRFHRDGAASAGPFAVGRLARVLFDKWFEERETQAAESWRIHEARERLADRTDSGDFCVSAITMTRQVPGQPGQGASRVKVPVTQRFLG